MIPPVPFQAPWNGMIPQAWRTWFQALRDAVNAAVSPSGSGLSPTYLGGDRARSLVPATWLEVVNYIPFIARGSFTGTLRVECFAQDAGVTVTARLWDVTAGAAAITLASVTSQVATERSATGSITSGHRYQLQAESSPVSRAVYAIGQLEVGP